MPLKLYRRNGVWHYRGTVGPTGRRQRMRGSCQTENKDIAARFIAEIEKRYWDGHFDGPGAILTFRRAAQLYRAAGKSDKFLGPVEEYLKDTLVKDITRGLIRQMAIELFDNAPSRNRRAITPVQAVINHAAESDLCQHIRVKRFPTEKSEKEPATLQWVRAFQAYAKPHLGAYALFMFLTGCRPSEALAVDPKTDLDLKAATVVIRETKMNNGERKAHLPAILVAALANLEPVAGRPLFVYRKYIDMRWSWHHTIAKAGIHVLTPHCCRHGFATELIRRGLDVKTIAWLGGWASPAEVLKTYGHAIKKRSLTDLLTDTPLTQAIDEIAKVAAKRG